MDRDYMLQRIAVLFGGRIAEEIFMHQMTTGACNDFERATQMARDMVTRYGMSDTLGPMVYAENEGEVFLGRSIATQKNVSEETMRKVDLEIRRIIDEQYAVARKLIEDNRDKVEAMAKALLEVETIDSDQVEDIMQGRPPRPPKPVSARAGHDVRPATPVRTPRPRPIPPSLTSRRPTGSSGCSRDAGFPLRGMRLRHDRLGRDRRPHADLRPAPARSRPAARDGRAQRHARFLFRRRPLRRPQSRAGPCAPDARRRRAIIDIGGESTRPGAAPTSEHEELDRVLPLFEALRADCDARGVAALGRHAQARGDARGDRRRRLDDQRHRRAARRRRDRRRRGERRRRLPDAHAGRAADDAARAPCTTTTSSRT